VRASFRGLKAAEIVLTVRGTLVPRALYHYYFAREFAPPKATTGAF
jgi:hypothetical protein